MTDPKFRREAGRWRLLTFLLLLITIALLIAIIVILVKTQKHDHDELPECSSPNSGKYGHINLEEPDNPPVFHDLTSKEIKGMMDYLFSIPGLNLVKSKDKAVDKSYVFLSELHLTNKNTIIGHLDNNDQQPKREARVIIFRGDKPKPDIEEYIVGPLPNPNQHKHVPYRPSSIPFTYRPVNGPEHGGVISKLTSEVHTSLGTMLEEVFGGKLLECGSKCLIFRYITPVSSAFSGEKRRKTWYWLSQFAEYFILHPLNMAVYVDMDVSNYTVENVWFNDKLFNSYAEVKDYYDRNKASITKVGFPDDSSKLFSSLNQRGDPPIDPPLRNPVQVSPDGKRYNVNGRHVEYMFWDFDFRMSAIRGPQLYDIKYKNERIAYELSVQEIAVFYAGYKPMHQMANYLDGLGLVGVQAKGLVPGIDCPKDASYLSTTFQVESDEAFSFENAFCIFEYNIGIPLRRHNSYSFSYGRFYEGMESTILVLRTVAVIVNYDYIIDFMFYPNGVIQVKVVSTGYVLASFFTDNVNKYSFELHEQLAANIHQHLFNFKVDLDIKGQSNRFATANVETEKIQNRFSKNKSAKLVQHKFSTSLKTTELDAAYKFDFHNPKYLLVYNEEDKKNTEYKRGKSYRIINNGMSKQMLPAGEGNEPSISWARYQVAITKQKDTEPTSSTVYSFYGAEDPVVDFQSFLNDNENIVDKDLVAWVTMGLHHIPHTEDLPVTPTPGMDLSFLLSPYNYFDEDPAMSSLNAIRIEPKDKMKMKTSLNINRYGVKQNMQCVPGKDKYDETIEKTPSILLDTEGTTFL